MSEVLRALIVEDSQDDADLLLRELRRAGYDVEYERVETAEAMNAALDRSPWDVIFSDFSMPHFSAPAALALLKDHQLDIPFIIISGTIGEETAVSALKAGAHDFLVKGNMARLIPALQRELREAESRRERHRAEEALRESEERFRQVADTIDEVFWVADAKGSSILYVSPAYEAIWGRTCESLYEDRHSFFESVLAEDRERVASQLESPRDGRNFDVEYRIVRPDGGIRWIWDRGFPVRSESGEIRRYLGVAVDITKRKNAEGELRESEERFRLLFAGNPLPMWVYDLETLQFEEVNDAAVARYGYSREEFLALRITDIRPLADAQRLLENVARPRPALEDSGPWRHRLKDGRIILVQVTSHLLTWNGRPSSLVVAQDITERVLAEGALRESEERFRATFENAGIGMAMVDLQGHPVKSNPALQQMFGYSEQELRAMVFTDYTHPDDRKLDWDLYGELVAGKREKYALEKRFIKKSGEVVWAQMTVSLVRDRDGRPEGAVGMVQDVTERKLAESENARLAVIVNSSDDAIYSSTRDGLVVTWNPGAERMYGYSADEIRGKHFSVLLPEKRRTDIGPNLERLYEDGAVVHFDTEHVRKDGSRLQVSLTLSPIKDAAGSVRGVSVVSHDIAARKRAEEALRESEQGLAAAQRIAHIGSWNWNVQTDITDWSDETFRIFGASPDQQEYDHRVFLGLINPADRVRVERALGEALEGIREYNIDYRIRLADGTEKVIHGQAEVLRDEDGKPTALRGINHDITESRRSERALRESEQGLAAAQRIAHIGSWNWNVQTDTADWSDETFRIFGLNRGELEDHRRVFLELIHPADRERVDRALTDALLGVQEYDLDYRIRLADGTEKIIHGQAEVLRDESGTATNLRGIVQDITERKRSDAERARLVTAIENSAEAVVMTNSAGDIEYVSPAFTRITGYTREEVLGHNPRILKSDKQEPAFYEDLWATIRRGENWSGELVNRRKDGSLYTEEMNIAPVRGERGEVTHYIAIKQDVTERKLLEQQFRQAQKMEAVGRLAGGVAHDFNNLLMIINGYSDLVLQRLAPDDPNRVRLQEIHKAGDRAASLTRQLLAFSRKQIIALRVLDLNTIVAEVEKMLRRLIGEDIRLSTILDPTLHRVTADPGQIEQILMNLAVNARDAMPQGGKIVLQTANVVLDDAFARTHVGVPPGQYVMLSAADNGFGMSAEVQAHIFEPFFTTKEKGKGTGLGLATVYGIVQQSGGHIHVESEPGRGATFKIYLPAAREAAATALPAHSEMRAAAGSETILLIEDEVPVRTLAKIILQSLGYKVLESTSPEDALQIAERLSEPIDLLLTDMVLPQMSGRQVAEHLSSLRPGIKVLYMSGYSEEGVVGQGVLDAGVGFVQKPLTPDALGRKVRELLDGARTGDARGAKGAPE